MSTVVDQAQIMNSAMEKKAKQFDRIVGECKQKVDDAVEGDGLWQEEQSAGAGGTAHGTA